MARRRYNAEEIIHKLREADVLLVQGQTVDKLILKEVAEGKY